MLEKKVAILLRIVVKMCGEKFQVIDKNEIIKAMGVKYYVETPSLMIMLRLLAGKDLITIKYEDETEVCLCATRKGVDYVEDVRIISNANTNKAKITYRVYIIVFICALLGAIVGSILAELIKLAF